VEEHVATFNVKSVPDRIYRKLKTRASGERRSISQEVIRIRIGSTMMPVVSRTTEILAAMFASVIRGSK
jgi:hypothetical protein